MTALRHTTLPRGADERGFVLAEVLIAVVLLAVLIVPLATGMTAAADQASRVRAQAEGLPAVTSESATRAAWGWGPKVEGLRWASGPTAAIEVGTVADPESVVGVWTDGWFLGEWSLDGGHILELPAATWSGLEGAELTVRVRRVDGSWGPPWRSTIPGERFDSVPATDLGSDVVEGDGATTGGETVVHVPGLANPDVAILQTGTALHVDRLGLVFYLLPASIGISDIRLGDVVQSWRVEDGRALDLYF